MHKILFCIYAIALTSLIGCEKSTDDPTIRTSFVINKENETDFKDGMKFDCNEWRKIVKFSTNKSWQVTTGNSSWIRVSPNEGEAGDIELDITINPNYVHCYREDTITIISGDITKIIKVTQSPNDEIIIYSDKYEVDVDGESINANIYSNIN